MTANRMSQPWPAHRGSSVELRKPGAYLRRFFLRASFSALRLAAIAL